MSKKFDELLESLKKDIPRIKEQDVAYKEFQKKKPLYDWRTMQDKRYVM